ncbi:MAG: glycosyltransferase [Methyloceanibacter sp.]
MRILWLAKRHYTNKDAFAERFGRVYELPREWARTGIDTRLELLDYHGPKAESATDCSFHVASTPVRSIRHMRTMLRNVSAFRPDVIVASGDCFIGLFALWLARRTPARFVFDVYDDYRKFGGYRAFLDWDAYGFLLRRAQLVLYASKALADRQACDTPWQLVPNGVDPDQFGPIDIAEARRSTGLDQKGARWVGYFGGMDAERGAEDLITAVGLLHANNDAIRLVLCGKPREGLPSDQRWVDFRGNVEHTRIPDFINACDVVTLPYRRGPIIDMASSCKIAEYLFCERPLVATDTPNLLANFPLQAAELGPAICKPGDPADLARAIGDQLAHGRIASRPEQHTWGNIAREALAVLR